MAFFLFLEFKLLHVDAFPFSLFCDAFGWNSCWSNERLRQHSYGILQSNLHGI